MERSKPFFQYLHKFVDLSEEEYKEHIQPYITIRQFDKKKAITKVGEVEDYLNFIVNGLARKYYKRDGDEVNTQISFEGHIIHAQESFHSRKPSEYIVETLEPTTFVSITYADLEKIYARDIKLERLGRLVITFTMIQKDNWQLQLVKYTPRERFLFFVDKYPDLLQRVPQKHLASYLQIQPETFSRFKHLIRSKK